MTTDPNIEQFIGESFSSIWDLELLAIVIDAGERSMSAAEIETQMRGSQLVVEQGMQSLSAAGLVSLEGPDRVRFSPVDDTVARCAREAVDFYRRFPGRARRLMISRQAPGLSAFANAFRLRKDNE
jgi:hypothetical protein